MTTPPSAASVLTQWAEPAPEIGRAVYRLTHGPREHKHNYYYFSPWSPDQSTLLLARYDRVNPEAEICVMDAASGIIRAVGVSRKWNSHNVAFQQWQGERNRIFYISRERETSVLVTSSPDGSDVRSISVEGLDKEICGSRDGHWAYAATDFPQMFPDDALAPRGDKGLFRINLDTGARELILSVEQALSCLPDARRFASCHLFIKRIIEHPRLPRLLFNLTNTFWDRDGKEPVVRCIITVGTDGSNPVHLGAIRHHPNWHPAEDLVVANVGDCNNCTRFGLYRGDGSELLDYVPRTNGSGHPSFSPDGRWIFTDAAGPRGNQLIFCDPSTGQAVLAAEYDGVSAPYASFKAIDERAPGETVIAALARAAKGETRTWQTQCHPAWSRDGSAILFNADIGTGSQLYAVDVRRALDRA